MLGKGKHREVVTQQLELLVLGIAHALDRVSDQMTHLSVGERAFTQIHGIAIRRSLGRAQQLGAVLLDDAVEGCREELPHTGRRAQPAFGDGGPNVVVPGVGAFHLSGGQSLPEIGPGALGDLEQNEHLSRRDILCSVVVAPPSLRPSAIGREHKLMRTAVRGIDGIGHRDCGRRILLAELSRDRPGVCRHRGHHASRDPEEIAHEAGLSHPH